MPNEPKPVLFMIRTEYYNAIVAGTKKEEIRADKPKWRWMLDPEKAPKIAVFMCGRRIHRRWITRIYKDHAHNVLGRPVSEQGMEDLGLLSRNPEDSWPCIITELGDVYE